MVRQKGNEKSNQTTFDEVFISLFTPKSELFKLNLTNLKEN